jgi:hypothetical protein
MPLYTCTGASVYIQQQARAMSIYTYICVNSIGLIKNCLFTRVSGLCNHAYVLFIDAMSKAAVNGLLFVTACPFKGQNIQTFSGEYIKDIHHAVCVLYTLLD